MKCLGRSLVVLLFLLPVTQGIAASFDFGANLQDCLEETIDTSSEEQIILAAPSLVNPPCLANEKITYPSFRPFTHQSVIENLERPPRS